jgi:hypothetical protein
LSDGAEVGHGFTRVGFVDHGGQDHQAVETDALAVAGETAGSARGDLGDAGQHRHAPAERGLHLF